MHANELKGTLVVEQMSSAEGQEVMLSKALILNVCNNDVTFKLKIWG